jgi:CHAT domain-containing protein/tetratricopeptide (TPR) repeat protein
MVRLLFSLLFACTFSFAQVIPTAPNKTDKKGKRQGDWVITYDKNWKPTQLKDSISFYRKISYKDDKPIGTTTDYYLSGKKQFEGTLTADRPQEIMEGSVKWFYENGSLSRQATMVAGQKEGEETTFYENGKKYATLYNIHGLVEGKVIYYTDQGEVDNVEFYEKGEKQSLQKIWDQAMDYFNQRSFKESEDLMRHLYVSIKKSLGADEGNLAYLLNYLWQSQYNLGKNDEAIKNADEMCRVRELQKVPKDSVYRDWLHSMVVGLVKTGHYDRVDPTLEKLFAIQKEISGENSGAYFTLKRRQSEIYQYMKRYPDAEKVLQENITVLKKLYSNQPDRYNSETAALGELYERSYQYQKAEKLYREAVEQYRIKKDTTQRFASVLYKLMHLYETQDKNLDAIPYAKERVSLQKTRKGTRSEEYADALSGLNKYYRETGQFDLVHSTIKEHTQIIETLFGTDSYDYASEMHGYGLLYSLEGKYDLAEESFLKSISILKRKNAAPNTDEEHILKQAEVSAYLGELYTNQKNIIKAEIILAEALELVRSLKDKSMFLVAQVYEKIGTSQFKIENYDQAEVAYKEALNIAKNIYGTNHNNYYVGMANLCLLYTYTDRAQLALNLLNEELAGIKKTEGHGSPSYIAVLHTKVLTHETLAQRDSAISQRKEIVAYYLKTFGETNTDYFKHLCKLAMNQALAHHAKESFENMEKVDELVKKLKIKPTDELYYGQVLELKLAYYSEIKDQEKAVAYAQEQVSIGQLIGQPKLGRSALALYAMANNQPIKAEEAYRTYIDLVMEDVRNIFPYLSESQKVGFYNSQIKFDLDLYYFIALAEPLDLKMGRDSSETKKHRETIKKLVYIRHPNNAYIFNYQLLTKGILFEANQKEKQVILNSKDQNLIQLYYQWQSKKEQMSKLFQEHDSKQKEEKKNNLNEDIRVLEKQMALRSSYFNKGASKRYTWVDVQKKLRKDEALVEMLAVSAGKKLNPTTTKYSDTYLAFVITPETKDYPLCVLIGSGDSLEGRYLKNYQNSIRHSLPDRYSYRKYWKVLADTLKATKKIYFVPDGVYHKVNVNTLQNTGTGKYVLEEKEIHFTSQSRDFIERKTNPATPPSDIVLFGAPNYNSLPNDSIVKATPQKERAGSNALKKDTTQRFFSGNEITELPGTKEEVNNVASIADNNRLRVKTFLGDNANESALKNVYNPSILHIATHGFFISESSSSDDGSKSRSGFANFSYEDLKNPLRRSGLLLSYCKQAFQQDRNKMNFSEDGILTAEEAQNLHLDQTDMVVLSACETGLGEVKNGEGVYGLQRSFQTAGAKSVLMSLWTVSDEATERLMTLFYSHWFKLKDRRMAFRQAQFDLKQKFPEPFYWGAFVMVGE